MAIDSLWASMSAWFTTPVLFCAANLIIATIFFASNSNNNNNKHRDQFSENSMSQIGRVSSFVDRVRSMNLSSATTIATTTTTAAAAAATESEDKYPSQLKTANYSSSSRLAQSIYSASDNVTPTELPNGDGMYPTKSEMEPVIQSVHAPSLFERVKSIKFSSAFPAESEQISDSSTQLVRAPSFFDRVKSFRISSAFTSGAQPDNFDNSEHHVIRSKSDTIKSAKKSSVEMKKSRSEIRIATEDDDEDVNLRRPATARESRNNVDAEADDFITRFKQQLKLQRLESLVRYNEMLNRGN